LPSSAAAAVDVPVALAAALAVLVGVVSFFALDWLPFVSLGDRFGLFALFWRLGLLLVLLPVAWLLSSLSLSSAPLTTSNLSCHNIWTRESENK